MSEPESTTGVILAAQADHKPTKFQFLKSIVGLFVRIPVWLFFSLPPFRPRKSWNWKKAFNLQLMKHFVLTSPLPKGPSYKIIAPNLPPECTAVWIKGIDESLIQGDLAAYASKAGVKPEARLPAYWRHLSPKPPLLASSPPINAEEKVILFFHGGGYAALSAVPDDPTQAIVRGTLSSVAKQTPNLKRVLSFEYRLTTFDNPPHNPFPTALIDALSAYIYVTSEVGFAPSNVIIMGDSAGGNLALALTRYIIRTPSLNLKPPGGLILHSPWIDLGVSHRGPGTSNEFDSDYLVAEGDKPARAFTYPWGFDAMADSDVYVSPGSLTLLKDEVKGMFIGFPKTFITAGGGERLLDSIRTLDARMASDIGRESVTYFQGLDAVHDFLIFSWTEPERTEALEACAHWFANI
ncbi:alpha/beta-hydrolase [Sistotremastrum suecicum HHB10207 ss-3]|uniref:Alpha/beta-hydrolase n=1 Tax=Sistotremastrum suecicum HHB10207 ss-3 TaxID=1314776 RepID=A0A166FML9_9AGAM|nr:alpha/beta-hydrolase [Sistotremastrum suecicum HHB10207 ss-3]